jgi:hypothetical protein
MWRHREELRGQEMGKPQKYSRWMKEKLASIKDG